MFIICQSRYYIKALARFLKVCSYFLCDSFNTWSLGIEKKKTKKMCVNADNFRSVYKPIVYNTYLYSFYITVREYRIQHLMTYYQHHYLKKKKNQFTPSELSLPYINLDHNDIDKLFTIPHPN